MQTIETTVHGVSISNRVPSRLEVDKSCEGQTIYVDQNDYEKELSNIKEGYRYCIDSLIDLKGLEIEIPSYGLDLHGMSSEAGLIDSTDGHTMFKSQGSGSGNVVIRGINLTQTGNDSTLFYIWSEDQWNDFTFQRNIMNVQSAGAVYGYDQLIVNKNLPLNQTIRFIYDDNEEYFRYS